MIPFRQLNTVGKSLPKKLKEKLKPISESSIKVDDSYKDNEFFSVEKINLIDGEMRMRQHVQQHGYPLANVADGQKLSTTSDHKSKSDVSFQRMEELKKYKEYKMNPQLYIKRL